MLLWLMPPRAMPRIILPRFFTPPAAMRRAFACRRRYAVSRYLMPTDARRRDTPRRYYA